MAEGSFDPPPPPVVDLPPPLGRISPLEKDTNFRVKTVSNSESLKVLERKRVPQLHKSVKAQSRSIENLRNFQKMEFKK